MKKVFEMILGITFAFILLAIFRQRVHSCISSVL